MKKQFFLLAMFAINAFAFAANKTESIDQTAITALNASAHKYTDDSWAFQGTELQYEASIMANKDMPWLQLRDNATPAYIKIKAPGKIVSIALTITSTGNSSGGQTDITKHNSFDTSRGKLMLRTTLDGDTLVASNAVTDNAITLTVPSGDAKTLYLQSVKVSCRIWGWTVTYENNGGSIEVKHVESVALNVHEKNLSVYETLELTATIAPADADDKKVTWTSSDDKVATVSEKGFVRAIAAGNANIVAKTEDGEKTDTCKLTIEAAKKSEYVLVAPNALKDKDTVIITMTVDSIGIPMLLNAEGATGYSPEAILGGIVDYSIVPVKDNVVFVAHKNTNGIKFVPKEYEMNEEIILCVSGSSNDGVRVKKLSYKTESGKDSIGYLWKVDDETGYLKTSYLTKNDGKVTRYLGVYNGSFRAYARTAMMIENGTMPTNIKEQTLKIFIKGHARYFLTTHSSNNSMGMTQGDTIAEENSQVNISAVSYTGYHFAKWSDGDINNPRTVQLTQDSSFTAEFAKNIYTITAASNNVEYGFASGGKTTEYLNNVTLTATPQFGHHFEYWQSGSTKYKDNPLTVTVKDDATYTAYFAPNVYTVTVNANSSQGYVTAPAQATFLQEVTLTATPMNGYEFVQWSDGNTDNPRVFTITQDTSFTAEFAKAKYTIAAESSNGDKGWVTGGKDVEYLTSVTLTATAFVGYHFDHWESNMGSYTANPLTVTATANATYIAWFKPNTYSINVYSDNSSLGGVSAPSSAEYQSNVTLTANPVKGAAFVQWSDGETENPRTIQITQDTTLSAEFAVLTSGHYYADVSWYFRNNTLYIAGIGQMYGECTDSWELLIPQIQKVVIDENITRIIPVEMGKLYNLTSVVWNATNYTAPTSETEAPFYSRRSRITSFEFGKQVKKIPAYLCNEMTGLTSVTIGSNVTNIGKYAFAGCEDLEAITCEATTPPNCGTDAFAGVSIFIPVYVPVSSVEKYAKAPIWKEFDAFSSIQAESKTVSDVQATPTENAVVIEWPAAVGADIYTLVIKRGDVTFCTLSFNAQGQLMGIQFAPGRNGNHNATYATQTATGWQFMITSLDSGTTYKYSVTAAKEDNTPVYSQSGSFTTMGTATGVEGILESSNPEILKFVRNGQLYILRDGVMYNAQGARVE